MDEVHGRVGLQQAAPGALPGVRLAGHQQHAQAVADAVHLDNGAVVELADLAGQGRDLQFRDGGTAAGDGQRDFDLPADGHILGNGRLAVAAERQAGGAGGIGHAQVVHGDLDGNVLANDSEGRRLDHADAAVSLLALGGNQDVDGAGGRGGGDVVDLAVGEGDDAGQAGAGDVGQGAVYGGEQSGAVVPALRHVHGAQLQVRDARGLLLQAGAGGVAQGGAVANGHAGGLVHDEQRDVAQGVAGLADQPGAGEPGEQHEEGQAAPGRAAGAAEDGGEQGHGADGGQGAERPPGDGGVEAEGGVGLVELHAVALHE